VNTAMGKDPLYPFEIPPPVIRKLGFVHKLADGSGTGGGSVNAASTEHGRATIIA
jgi:hypothetical protein